MPRQFKVENREEAFVHIKRLSLSIAAHDAAAFHLILSSAACDLSRVQGSNHSVEEISHKVVALRHINERMADMALATSDQNIGAVTIFAGFEV